MLAVIACGGTGGHLFPGLAVAQVLRNRGHEVLLLVSEKEIDTQALRSHPEFRFERLATIGMPSMLSPAFLSFLQRMSESLRRCGEIYERHRPAIVLGMGGFTAVPPILAAKWRKIPSLIHESNAIPGKANRFSARFATRVLLGFEECATHFPNSRTEVTGTPIRENLRDRVPREEAMAAFKLSPGKRTLLIMGGSQGASGVNKLLFQTAPFLREADVQIIHFTGDRDDRLAAANYLREGIPAYVEAFYPRMELAYSAADLVISRAGAASISELSHFGLPTIFIPYPYAADNHQEANARILVERAAGLLVKESDAQPEILARTITGVLLDPERHAKFAAAAKASSPEDPAARVADIVEEVAK